MTTNVPDTSFKRLLSVAQEIHEEFLTGDGLGNLESYSYLKRTIVFTDVINDTESLDELEDRLGAPGVPFALKVVALAGDYLAEVRVEDIGLRQKEPQLRL